MKQTSIIIVLCLVSFLGYSQSKFLKLGTNPMQFSSADAGLEIESVSKGILFPRVNLLNVTDYSPLSTFTDGMVLYNSITQNSVYKGLYFSFNNKWNPLNFKSNVILPNTNLGITNGMSYTNSSRMTFGPLDVFNIYNDCASCRNLTFYGPTWTFFGSFGNTDTGSSGIVYNFKPYNLPLTIWRTGDTFDIGSSNIVSTFNSSIGSKFNKSLVNTSSYNIELATSTMQLNGGVIQRGGTAALTATSDLGLYSLVSGNYIRLATNTAPIRFYSDLYADGSSAGTNCNMTIEANGNVGIGLTTPVKKLSVAGSSVAYGPVESNLSRDEGGQLQLTNPSKNITLSTTAYEWSLYNMKSGGQYVYPDGLEFWRYTNNLISGPAVIFGDNGNVGIGTTNTSTIAKLEIYGDGNYNFDTYNFFVLNRYDPISHFIMNMPYYCVWASGRVAASEFNAFSDARLKNNKGKSDGKKDVAILKNIEVTNYTKKDSISDPYKYKKVIAQQVEQVYPQAVRKTKGFIPDVYKTAQAENGKISVPNNFKKRDVVKLIIANEELSAVVQEATEQWFIVDKPLNEKVFVFGKEVDDLRTVDYEAIAMLNVSATQEIANRFENINQQLEELDTKSKVLLSKKDELIKKLLTN